MGARDIITVEYFSDNRRFADIINGRFFQGREVVKPDKLEEADKELLYPWTKKGEKALRDNVMKWMGDTLLAIFVAEHQSEVDYHMIFRIMHQESLAYLRQWNKKKKQHLKEKDLDSSAEFLSGMKKEDRFCPVLTLVVYYGKEPYDGATSLHELLDWQEETKGMKKYISDYHINVFDYHKQKNFEEFHTELQLLFEFLRYASDKNALKKKLAEKKEAYYNVDEETYNMIAILTNSREMLKYKEQHAGEEENNMCQAITEMIEDGRREGEALGRQEGEKLGKKEGEQIGRISVAKNLLDILSDEVIAEKTGLAIETVKALRE